MRNGELITRPDNPRRYEDLLKDQPTGGGAPIESFSRQQIGGQMTPEEFAQNEKLIMEQLRNGQIRDESYDFTNYGINGAEDNILYTRENIGKMSSDEFSKHEKAIMSQMKTHGIPSKRDMQNNKKFESSQKSKSQNTSNSSDGKWVTINGNHVLIKD